MMNIKLFISTLLLCALIFSNFALSGEIAPELTARISNLSGDDMIPVIITLKKPAYKSNLKSDMAKRYKTAAERHRAGMEQLKSEAATLQGDLISSLNQLQQSGLAENVKSRWIINGVTADLARSEIADIASRPDVAMVYELPGLHLVESSSDYAAASPQLLPSSPEPNIKLVGADSAWALGYNGAGRIVCSFDTGVEGIHPALFDKWKGHDGDSAAAWFDPIGMESFPHVFGFLGDDGTHGTHTMGIMVGACDTMRFDKDSIGIAPGAKWISAAVVSLAGVSLIDAFEWAADPDGDPNTISDVPDVINHSWYNLELDCSDYFHEMIENTEALGIVNVFAGGNSGPNSRTMTNPANLAFDSLDCFAVGSIYYGDSIVSGYSSRGPSECNPLSIDMIKPNLVAPGDSIWSSTGSNYVSRASGTSMAAPHVSGAVAILRQYAPDATVDEIKQALIAGAVHPSMGEPYPNNNYGWGVLYIPSALEALDSIMHSPVADLRIYSFDQNPVLPGDTVSGTVVIKNVGSDIDGVIANIAATADGMDLLVNSLQFGTILSGDTAHSDIPFRALVHDTVTTGTLLSVDIEMTGAGGYLNPAHLYIRVGTTPEVSYYTHSNGALDFTISNFGEYGFAFYSFYPLNYSGFRYLDMTRNDLFEGAFLVGTDSAHISDGVRNIAGEPDNDFAVAPGGDLVVCTPGTKADQQTYSVFDDSKAENPIGLEITQKTYTWNDPPADNIVIMEYIIKNVSDSLIDSIYAGLLMDWDLHSGRIDSGNYNPDSDMGYMWHGLTGSPDVVQAKYRGICVLSEEGMTTHKMVSINEQSNTKYNLSEGTKYQAIASNILGGNPFNMEADFWVTVGTGPFNLAPGTMDTAVFALVAADTTLDNLIAAAAEARNMYDIVTNIEIIDNEILPERFALDQNYPNPFNPSTTISFSLTKRSHVELSIYNLLGQKVINLIDKELSAGNYRTSWDGRDKFGDETAGGVYFYRLKTGESSQTRKMVLLK